MANAQTAGKWDFKPERDAFSPNALLDLRSLNEKIAGESGFVRRSKDGNDLVLGNGKPARFWTATTYQQRDKDDAKLAHHARWLAKRGVNIARTLVDITPRPREGWGAPNSDNPNDVNRKELDLSLIHI